jgi:hypothetical protein
MPRPQTAEAELRAAFERLKNDTPHELPKGSGITLTNVAAEARKPPSSLRKDRYPRLYKEITAYAERPSSPSQKIKLSMAIYFDPPLANKIDPPFIVYLVAFCFSR